MFRDLRRKKQALSRDECIELLINEPRGVLSVLGDDDYPYGLPINHYYHDDGCLYFHGAKVGHKIDAINKHSKVSYCVYDQGYRNEGEWALNIKSVIVFGTMETVEDLAVKEKVLRNLSHKFTQDEAYIDDEINRLLKVVNILKLTPDHMSGKLVNES